MSQNGGAELCTGGPVSGMLAAPITARSRPPHHTSFWQRPHSEQKELKAHGRLPSSTSVYSDGLLEVPELLYMYMDTQTWKWTSARADSCWRRQCWWKGRNLKNNQCISLLFPGGPRGRRHVRQHMHEVSSLISLWRCCEASVGPSLHVFRVHRW